MATTATTLAVAASADDRVLSLTSVTGLAADGTMYIKVDQEFMFPASISGTKVTVRNRGYYGTRAVAHNVLASVTFGLISDLPALSRVLPDRPKSVVIGANGAIPVPTQDTVYFINKGSALGSSAIADPDEAQDDVVVSFVSLTDFAHVITFTNLHDGTTGAHTTATMAAFKGASFQVIAKGGKWFTLGAPQTPAGTLFT